MKASELLEKHIELEDRCEAVNRVINLIDHAVSMSQIAGTGVEWLLKELDNMYDDLSAEQSLLMDRELTNEENDNGAE